MNVLIACEYSGAVRDAFTARGHYALSCDFLPTETPGRHHQGDVRDVLANPGRFFPGPISLMVAHPSCQYLASSGAKHLYMLDRRSRTIYLPSGDRVPNLERHRQRDEAVAFVLELAAADIPRIAIENPVGMLSSRWRKADQYVQPWEFGHGEVKRTGLWLKGLPLLEATNVLPEEGPNGEDWRHAKVHKMGPHVDRWKDRSRTYPGIAAAMADQWGDVA